MTVKSSGTTTQTAGADDAADRLDVEERRADAGPPGAEHRGVDASGSGEGDRGNEAGRLGVNDRGNVTWEWAEDLDQLPDDDMGTAERLILLVNQNMQVHDEESDPATKESRESRKGYDPYDRGEPGRPAGRARRKDLKKLSRWIELRKRMSEKDDNS